MENVISKELDERIRKSFAVWESLDRLREIYNTTNDVDMREHLKQQMVELVGMLP